MQQRVPCTCIHFLGGDQTAALTPATEPTALPLTDFVRGWLLLRLIPFSRPRAGDAVLYTRTTQLLEKLHVPRGDGSFKRRLGHFARLQVLVLDDFALTRIAERAGRSAGAAGRPRGHPGDHHHQPVAAGGLARLVGDPTLVDAIMDQVVHGAPKIALKGESMWRSCANAARVTETAMAGGHQPVRLIPAPVGSLQAPTDAADKAAEPFTQTSSTPSAHRLSTRRCTSRG